jgi:hypothetical protein
LGQSQEEEEEEEEGLRKGMNLDVLISNGHD